MNFFSLVLLMLHSAIATVDVALMYCTSNMTPGSVSLKANALMRSSASVVSNFTQSPPSEIATMLLLVNAIDGLYKFCTSALEVVYRMHLV